MCEKAEPSRADLAEISNLVALGADVFMLTIETSQGKYPFEAMKVLSKTIAESE
jgi:pyruvate kinase